MLLYLEENFSPKEQIAPLLNGIKGGKFDYGQTGFILIKQIF